MNNKQNEKGYTLVGVLLVFTILAILGMSLVMLSFASVKTSTKERDHQSVYYIAEAGLNYEIEKINQAVQESDKKIEKEFADLQRDEKNATEEDYQQVINTEIQRIDNFLKKYKEITKSPIQFEKVNNIEPRAEIKIIEVGQNKDGKEYELKSTGIIDEQSRTVISQFQIGWDLVVEEVPDESIPIELPPYAVFTSGNMELAIKKGGGLIKGNIGTISQEKHAIKAGEKGGRIVQEGNIYVPVIEDSNDNNTCKTKPVKDYKSYSVSRPLNGDTVPCPIELIDIYEPPDLPGLPTFPIDIETPDDLLVGNHKIINNGDLLITNYQAHQYVLEMEKDLKFGKMEFNSNRHLTINVGDTDKSIVVHDLLMTPGGHISLKGSGKLTLYVTGSFKMAGSSKINNNGDINKLNIFYKGSNPIKVAGSQAIYGSIYSKKSDANFELTGGGRIYGNIFTGGKIVKISGGSSAESQLILAPNAQVDVSEGGKVKGKIISNSFNVSGGGEVIMQEPFVTNGLISPEALDRIDSGSSGGNNGSSGGVKVIEAGFNMIQTDSIREE